MPIRLGYSGSNVSKNWNSGKQLRGDVSKDAAMRRLRTNLDVTYNILSWNHVTRIPLFRLGLHFISKPYKFDYRYMLNRVSAQLEDASIFVEDCGMRVTMHAIGSLGNPDEEQYEAVVEQLEYCYEVLSRLCPSDIMIVIHGGSKYRNRVATFKRIVDRVKAMPDHLRTSIGFENDDVWDVNEVMELVKRTRTNFIYDIHHHKVFPGYYDFTNDNITKALSLVRDSSIRNNRTPKVHVSSQEPLGVLGQHSQFIDYRDYARLRMIMHAMDFQTCDIMLEAGAKEQAVIELRNSVAARRPAWAVKQGYDYI